MHSQSSRISFALLLLAVLTLLPAVALAQHYHQTNLVSDIPGLAANTDPDLVNAWGIARGPASPWWVNANGTGNSILYNAAGIKPGLVVTVPPPAGSSAGTNSTPTGIVFNTDNDATHFLVVNPADDTKKGRAVFIFATEDGTIAGWSPTALPTAAVLEVPKSGAPTAIYKGLAIAQHAGATYLYAANFKSGNVDVFDSSWNPVTLQVDQFTDPRLPKGYVPFNVQNINGDIFVTFAQQGELPDEVDGRGKGFVDKFDSGGTLLMRFQHGPWLNAPWGVALAPADFGKFSNDLLVGNFGSGEIAAFNPTTGRFLGRLHSERGTLVIPGLWGIGFGGGVNLVNDGAANTLFFAAGIDDENHGLFGTLNAIQHGHDGDNDNDDR
jgi:uncharacterized protein (TIGR03118 family)